MDIVKKYEFMIFTTESDQDTLEAELNQAGEKGWQLNSITFESAPNGSLTEYGRARCIFQRALVQNNQGYWQVG